MKKNFTITLLFLTIIALAQPTNYYSSTTGLTGYALKTQLKKIIDDNNDGLSPEYVFNSQSYNSLDALYATSDIDIYYENDGTILDIYSENPSGGDPYNFDYNTDECGNYDFEGDCYNKEHVIPQSVFGSALPMYSDAYHLLPTDGRVNGFRSNYPIGIAGTLVSQNGISNPTLNGSKLGYGINTGIATGYTGLVFEPIDEFKGDIARIYFYFATRYEDDIDAWSDYAMFDGSNDKAIAEPFLAILLEWHANDPVSQKEIDRNNAIFNHQNNRNPYVDHPEWVAQIWSPSTDTTPPSIPTNLVVSNEMSSSVVLSWDASTDDTAVASYDVYVDGVYYTTVSSPTCLITGLSSETSYSFTVSANDTSGNNSGQSVAVIGTTTNVSTSVVELFFSEYLEGSSNNKALEIANFTGAAVSLENYTIKLSTNGSGTWSPTYTFQTGATIANEDVYVISNSGLAVCASESDYMNNSMTSFNGNDAIGLFKNDVLIDIIGTPGDSADFAKDVTLVRKASVLNPTTTFDMNEWDTYTTTNTCDDLGSHSVTLSNNNFELSSLVIYPNPSSSGIFNIATNNTIDKISIYNVNGQLIQLFVNPTKLNNEYQITNLTTGFYIIQLEANASKEIRKIIVN